MSRYELAGKRVYVAGHRGMVGSALVRRLAGEDCEVLTAGRERLDLKDQAATRDWFATSRPDAVFLAAARVGGIHANDAYPADFLYDNLMIEANAIEAAHTTGVEKLVFLGSTCIYPKMAPQPLTEDALLTGPLEPTNEWYAIAKIAGIKLCQAYRKQHGDRFVGTMPTNLYGPGDDYHPQNSHVIAGMFNRVRDALAKGTPFTVWGTGAPRREFLHVDDAADALVRVMQDYEGEEALNVGTGSDVSIAELAGLVAEVAGFDGEIVFDTTKPDGTPRKLTDAARMRALGWSPTIDLREGLARTWSEFARGDARNA